ncbi:O-antigen polysaccharide polymerase Wzy family protein [Erysipelothrix tonsillarum]|uniref:O-antigen polysaccharide polymerase Wzy family protein n=1 Tax=Erysipelothrix tonsillarum TaxID=38402 RepID=A0A6S6I1V7_9FIRM|nr:O-antigen polysaccharide polymerase Wzy family protein [Erysipelothrix tonsillarum]BCB22763.1 O-antigen polysaccharide polymerase Wzy family protein [Erysipelothrix tonsillarum]BCB22784.1 O-antigen polysaccharide polymerase Wzy family protein [Erysipelothrix tonsillarum]
MDSMRTRFKKNKVEISFSIMILSAVLFFYAFRNSAFNLMIISSYLLVIGILVNYDKDNIFLYIFYSTFFIFLLNRSLIDYLDGFDWVSRWDHYGLKTTMTILYLSVFTLYCGSKVYPILINKFTHSKIYSKVSFVKNEKKRVLSYKNHSTAQKTILLILFILLLVSTVAKMYIEIDKLVFMIGKNYEEFYLNYNPNYSLVLKFLADLNFYVLCSILAFQLKKKVAFSVLLINIITTLPSLIIGQRGSFILALLFSLVYYLIKQLTDKEQVWFGKYEKYLIIFGVPILVVLMIYINEGRHGKTFSFEGILSSFKIFLHKQGVSFDTLATGVENSSRIYRISPKKNFMFGEIINYLKYNPLSLKLFNTTPLPPGNNAIKALYGNSYAHLLSYLTHHSYLKGFGFGTSYLLEVFQTYGMLGLVTINLSLGVVLRLLKDKFNKDMMMNYFILVILSSIFYLPRQPFSSIMFFIFKPSFWFVIFVVKVTELVGKKFQPEIFSSKFIDQFNQKVVINKYNNNEAEEEI